jgi:hypothetical protein
MGNCFCSEREEYCCCSVHNGEGSDKERCARWKNEPLLSFLGCKRHVQLDRINGAVQIKRHFPRTFLCVVNMTDEAQSLAKQCGTSVHATEALLCNLQEQKIKQAMASSYIAPGALEGKYLQIYDLDRRDQMYIREDGMPVFKLHERYESIYCTATARAAMAHSIEAQSEESKDESLGVMDCGASITITRSLLNCVDVEEHKTIIETAKERESIMATQVCCKTYFVKNRVGDIVSTDFMDQATIGDPSVSQHREPEGAGPPPTLRGGLVYGRIRDRSGPTRLGMGLP